MWFYIKNDRLWNLLYSLEQISYIDLAIELKNLYLHIFQIKMTWSQFLGITVASATPSVAFEKTLLLQYSIKTKQIFVVEKFRQSRKELKMEIPENKNRQLSFCMYIAFSLFDRFYFSELYEKKMIYRII